MSAFGLEASVAVVLEVASVLVLALSDFVEASVLVVVLVLGEVAAFSDGLVLVADSAGLFAVEAGTVGLAAGFG